MNTTARYYEEQAQQFFDSTVSVDVSSLYSHFLKYVPSGSHILDFGCGSGRDSKAFLEMGYKVTAWDNSEKLCELAEALTGIKVNCDDFFSLNANCVFDAIWACASLLHVSSDRLHDLLARMHDAVVDGGIMYLSFKYGSFEGERNGRFFTDMTEDRFRDLLAQVNGLNIVEEWISEDARKDRSGKWYNVIIRKG